MSAVESVNALREAIRATDESVARGLPKPAAPVKKLPPTGQQRIADAASAVASLAGPYGAILKLFTGGTPEQDWKAFVAETLPRLTNTAEKSTFDNAVARFITLRGALAAKGYALPMVTVPVWTVDKETPKAYYAYGALALVAITVGVILLLKR